VEFTIMAIEKSLDSILNTNSKVKIIRLFASRRDDFVATGREIARLVGVTPPATHAALKELYSQDILRRDIIGKQHLYRFNVKSRVVKNILTPAFKGELSIKKDIVEFLKKSILREKLKNKIVSLIQYGSLQTGKTDKKSDVDIVIITNTQSDKQQTEKMFTEDISNKFHEYFGAHLDVYIKTKDEFIKRLKKNLSPISTLMRSYSVLYGKDPIDFK